MKFRVVGADMYTGEDIEIIITASTREAANKKAARQSIVVLSIDPADEHTDTPSTASIFDGLRPADGASQGGGGEADQHAARRAAATCQMSRAGRKPGRRGRYVFTVLAAVTVLAGLAAVVVAGRWGIESRDWVDGVVDLTRDAVAWLSEALRRVTG